jgi:hypothetical protein
MNKNIKIALIVGISFFLIVGAGLFLWLRFGVTTAHLRLIPREASMVAIVNVRNMVPKAEPKKLMQLKEFKQISGQSGLSKPIRTLLENPMDNGIDITQNIAAFMDNSGGSVVMGFVFKIDDDDLFAVKVPSAFGLARAGKIKDMWFLPIEANLGLAWNTKAGILLQTNDENSDKVAEKIANLMHQPDEFSILQNENYAAFAKKTFDIGVWVDNAALSKLRQFDILSSLSQQDEGWSDLLINFENETIDFTSSSHSENSAERNILRSSASPQTHFATSTDKNPFVFLNLALDMKKILNNLRKEPNVDENLKAAESSLGMSMDEIARIFTGDISFAVTDYRDLYAEDPIKQKVMDSLRAQLSYINIQRKFEDAGSLDESYGIPSKMNQPVMIGNLSITDAGKLEQLLRKMNFMQHSEGFWSIPGTGLNVYIAIKGSHVVITNSYSVANIVMQNAKLSGAPPEAINKSSAVAAWADLNPANYPALLTEEMKKQFGDENYSILLKAMQPLTHFSVDGSSTTDGKMKIHLKPGEGNSLYRLIAHEAKTFGSR